MAQLPDLIRSGVRAEDLDPQLAQQLDPLLRYANTGIGGLQRAMSGNLTLTDNLTCDVVTAKFTHAAATTVKLTRVSRAGSVDVLSADGQQVIGQAEVSVTGPQQAKVVLYFANTLARDVDVTLRVWPEGPGSKRSTTFKTAWTVPTLQNSWVDFDSSIWDPVGYYKDVFGRVHLRGFIKNGTAVPTVVFTLPAGYRPAKKGQYVATSNGAAAVVYVDSTGDVTAAVGSTLQFSLSGISFLAEQ